LAIAGIRSYVKRVRPLPNAPHALPRPPSRGTTGIRPKPATEMLIAEYRPLQRQGSMVEGL